MKSLTSGLALAAERRSVMPLSLKRTYLVIILLTLSCASPRDIDGLYLACPPGYHGDEWVHLEEGRLVWSLPARPTTAGEQQPPYYGRAYVDGDHLYFELQRNEAGPLLLVASSLATSATSFNRCSFALSEASPLAARPAYTPRKVPSTMSPTPTTLCHGLSA